MSAADNDDNAPTAKRPRVEAESAIDGDKMKHAKRAAELFAVLDGLQHVRRSDLLAAVKIGDRTASIPQEVAGESFVKTYLRVWLEGQMDDSLRETSTGLKHRVLRKHNKEDGRRPLGKAFSRVLEQAGWKNTSDKVTASWIACWLANVRPLQTDQNWEFYECSHRCTETTHFCVEADCLCWESKADNQSRGNGICNRACRHEDCKKTVCVCQKWHSPSCH